METKESQKSFAEIVALNNTSIFAKPNYLHKRWMVHGRCNDTYKKYFDDACHAISAQYNKELVVHFLEPSVSYIGTVKVIFGFQMVSLNFRQ